MKSSWVTLELAGVEATRLAPGDDLRAALEGLKLGTGGAAILTCVGSLEDSITDGGEQRMSLSLRNRSRLCRSWAP